jgi:transcriptional regulator with XRE-family HTH domain
VTHDVPVDARQQNAFPCEGVYITKPESQQQTKPRLGENARTMGKSARYTPTRELLRFEWLLQQLEDKGIGQKEVVELTGIKKSHLNQIKHHERYRKSGVGAEWIGLMSKGLRLDPAYFFDEYEGPADHRLYLLSAKRDEKRVASIEARVGSMESRMGVAESENERLRAENKALSDELNRRPRPRR